MKRMAGKGFIELKKIHLSLMQLYLMNNIDRGPASFHGFYLGFIHSEK